MGAPRLHIVDLDGAAAGEPVNHDIAIEIANTVLIPTQLGGGVRNIETVEKLLKAGIERVILGTSAIESPDLISRASQWYHDAIIVSIDTREGRVATRGWIQDMELRPVELAKKMVEMSIKRLICTDISRDGTLTEPNFAAIQEMVEALYIPVIAAGGVASLSHLKLLKKIGVEGAIVGKALYTGDINLKTALNVFNLMDE
jgi:phosphoribosylformimino-5-aminoimidazole carboxamide ribotide isomerase